MNKDVYILAIESSCDETSFSIVKNGKIDIATSISSQIDIHKNYGGVVPEIASREHLKNFIFVLKEVLEKSKLEIKDIDAIAVTYGPGLIGSLLIGVEIAKTLSLIYKKPLIAVNHMIGHIYSNNLNTDFVFPALILIVSGGHTDLVLMENHMKFKVIGSTLDDAVGECYDKVARLMDLEYPGGPKVDKLSKLGQRTYDLPKPLNDNSCNFSFSGLKSAVLNLVNKEKMKRNDIIKEDLACSFQETVKETFYNKIMIALNTYHQKAIYLAGGVSANSGIREVVEKIAKENNIVYSYPKLEYCTDNAAMIGAAAYYYYINNKFVDINLKAESQINNEYLF